MNDLISRQGLANLLVVAQDEDFITLEEYDKFCDLVSRVPSARPERKVGKWMLKKTYGDEYGNKQFKYFCSECGSSAYEFFQPYCHRCGARMMEEKDDICRRL